MAGAIYALKEAGFPVNSNFIKLNHEALSAAITNFHGGWKGALVEAGLDPREETRANTIKAKRYHGLID